MVYGAVHGSYHNSHSLTQGRRNRIFVVFSEKERNEILNLVMELQAEECLFCPVFFPTTTNLNKKATEQGHICAWRARWQGYCVVAAVVSETVVGRPEM